MKTLPVVWTIAGSDSGGGAGIQADLEVIRSLGGHGVSLITALTAQSPNQVNEIRITDSEMVEAQWRALENDLPPKAIKIGMIGSPDNAQAIATLAREREVPIVCDPVLRSSSGRVLTSSETLSSLREFLFPRVTLLTPNLPEAEALVGRRVRERKEVEAAAKTLLSMGPESVLIKGGHSSDGVSSDYWTNGASDAWVTSPRQSGPAFHGTGCALSSAVAMGLAQGGSGLESVVKAKLFVNRSLRTTYTIGSNVGLLDHSGWPTGVQPEDLPWLGERQEPFQDCGPAPIGFYPIVDRAAWLERLLPLGVTTIQLRIKDLSGEALEREIEGACEVSRRYGARLFVNDHWKLAIRFRAFGVHLGQEDLASADTEAIRRAGLRLGISTHDFSELARANTIRPSYAALGPIFPTTAKPMRHGPQGIRRLRLWTQICPVPVVAVGGISLESAPTVRGAGAGGIAVISDVTSASDPEARVRSWINDRRSS